MKAPEPQAVSVSLMIEVADTDAALARAIGKGATVNQDAREAHGSRNATIIDPFGHRWMLSGPVTGASVPIQHGDVGYVSVWTPDADRAAAFYGHVLGWTYDPITHQVTNTEQHIGIFSVDIRQGMLCCYAVTDLAGARQSIVDGGGTADDVQEFDFGTVLDAADPAGHRVRGVPARAGHASSGTQWCWARRAFVHHLRSGGLHGVQGVLQPVPVLGVRTRSGERRLADSADTSDGRCRGRRFRAVTVPMWTVADIDAAVARVREAGGTVIDEPSQQSYGRSALCTDDQGTRFYLGEF